MTDDIKAALDIHWDIGVVVFDCRRCGGTGTDPVRIEHDPDWCSACGGNGEQYVDLLAFAANLAVGAALTESFVLGEMYGLRGTRSDREARAQWCPNTKGKPAPGSEGGK